MLEKRRTILVFIASLFLTSCSAIKEVNIVDYYKSDAKESLTSGDYKRAKEDFEGIINKGKDDCYSWVGLLYTSYKLSEKNFEKLKEYTFQLKDQNMTLSEKIALLKRAENLLNELELANSFLIEEKVLNRDIKNYKIKNCKNLGDCKYCYPTSTGNLYRCSIEYAYLKYKKFSSGSFFSFESCNYKDFLKDFKIRDTEWHPNQVKKSYLAFQSLRKKYENIKNNLAENYYSFLVKKANKLISEGKFLEALKTYNDGIKTFEKLKKIDLKFSLQAQKGIFLKKLTEFLKRKYKECKNALCREAIFLYTKFFPENLKLNLPYSKNKSVIKLLTKKYCLHVKINSEDDSVKTYLIELLSKDKLLEFFPKAKCDNNLLISIEFNIDTKASVKKIQDYSYYPELPINQFLKYWVVRSVYNKSWKYCQCSGGWHDVKRRYYGLKDMISQTLNHYLGRGFNFSLSFANYYSYTVSLKGDYAIQMECIHSKNFQACVKKKEAELKNKYCIELNRLCNSIRQEYYSLSTTCPKQIFGKLIWETEKIYYDISLKGRVLLDGRKTYLGIFKEIPVQFSEKRMVENIYILEGNYELSCQYANDYRFSNITYEGKHFVCVKPHREMVNFNNIYTTLKNKMVQTIADKILRNTSPSVFLLKKLEHLRGKKLINICYFFYNVYKHTPFVQSIPKIKVLKEVEKFFF